jgi:hypothetical protein
MDDRVLTKAAISRGKPPPPLQVVAFEGRRRPNKDVTLSSETTTELPSSDHSSKSPSAPSLRRLRFEVARLCAKAEVDINSKLEAKQRLAISLGAKPPRAPGLNYLDLKKKRAEEKVAREEAEQLQAKGKVLKRVGRKGGSKRSTKPNMATPKTTSKTPKKLQSGILGAYGKVAKVGDFNCK